ncbi:zinc finger, C2H2, partial [Tanacetum coccineum]
CSLLASVDAESTEKPKVNTPKPVTADCLVEPEVKDSKQEPSPEDLIKNHAAKKDEAVNDKEGIEDGKKGRKKVKRVRSWVPFGCDEGRRVHLCTKCGWPFSNPYPSPKHRRSHKKHCGTIEGYNILIGAEAVSDDDHHGDTDKEKSPNDAGTEFSDSETSQGGSVKESLDKDLFYTFSIGENEAKKSTLGEAESPSAKKTNHAAKKDEAVNYKEGIEDDHAAKKEAVNDKEGIEDGKKGRKKVKRVRSWVPFVCCSAKSPSAKKTDHEAKKDEAVNDKEGDPMSPPKLIEDGDEGRMVHLCTKCGWFFSNPYPSPKHRRSHKKHFGTIEGYTVLIDAEASVSDDDHHSDTDKEKSPSEISFFNFRGQRSANAVCSKQNPFGYQIHVNGTLLDYKDGALVLKLKLLDIRMWKVHIQLFELALIHTKLSLEEIVFSSSDRLEKTCVLRRATKKYDASSEQLEK